MSTVSIASGFIEGLATGKGIKLQKERDAAEAAREERILAGGEDPRATAAPPITGGLLGYIDQTEGAGDYDTLYNHAQREGGAFAGTKITDMTLGDLYEFTDPSGAYGQYVADARTGAGEERQVATPLGRFQVVGRTLRGAAQAMNLDPSVKFTPQVQQAIGQHLIQQRLASAPDMNSKIAALRQEWVGLSKIPARDLAAAIAEWEGQ